MAREKAKREKAREAALRSASTAAPKLKGTGSAMSAVKARATFYAAVTQQPPQI